MVVDVVKFDGLADTKGPRWALGRVFPCRKIKS